MEIDQILSHPAVAKLTNEWDIKISMDSMFKRTFVSVLTNKYGKRTGFSFFATGDVNEKAACIVDRIAHYEATRATETTEAAATVNRLKDAGVFNKKDEVDEVRVHAWMA
jgi:predicted transcriptional regulator YheO